VGTRSSGARSKVAAATVPVEDWRILLARRAIRPSCGKWTFPGVDGGEFVDAAKKTGAI